MKLESLDLKGLLLPHSGSVFRDIETGMTECLKYYRNSSQHSSLTSSQFQSLNIACAQSYTDPIKNILFKCYSWQNMPLTSFKYRTASTGRQKRKKPLISHLIIIHIFWNDNCLFPNFYFLTYFLSVSNLKIEFSQNFPRKWFSKFVPYLHMIFYYANQVG